MSLGTKPWGDIQFGRYALIAFGILLVIGDYSLKKPQTLQEGRRNEMKKNFGTKDRLRLQNLRIS